MLKDNLSIFIAILVALSALILVSTLSSLILPILLIWTIILLFYYPYARLVKRFFKTSKCYSRCWRRLYRYRHFRKRLIYKSLLWMGFAK